MPRNRGRSAISTRNRKLANRRLSQRHGARRRWRRAPAPARCRRDGRGSPPSLRASARRARRRPPAAKTAAARPPAARPGRTPFGFGVAHRARDRFVRVAKRRAAAHQVVGQVGRGGEAFAAPPRACAPRSTPMPVATRSVMIASVSASVSTVSNSGSLSSWLSLLYVSGCAFISTSSATRWPITRPLLPRTSSGTSGFFFCGMIELPVQKRSASCTKPKRGLDHSTSSSAKRDRCTMIERGGGLELDREVAVGDGVERIGAQCRRSPARARRARGRSGTTCRRAPPRRAAAG